MINKNNDNKYGVLLFDKAWEELGKAIEPYFHEGAVGKYIYCKHISHIGNFVEMTLTPSQVSNKIDGFVKSPISALRFIPRHCGVP